MNRIHTSYKVSKMLKEFLGESAPEPMGQSGDDGVIYCGFYDDKIPAYQLHDLLSKPFCEAMRGKLGMVYSTKVYAQHLFDAYYDGGMEAVEKTLMEMMEGR